MLRNVQIGHYSVDLNHLDPRRTLRPLLRHEVPNLSHRHLGSATYRLYERRVARIGTRHAGIPQFISSMILTFSVNILSPPIIVL